MIKVNFNIDLSFKENTFSLAAIELNEAFKKTILFQILFIL